MQKNKNIRLTDIARLANVSVGTVDRVIHNRGRVSEENIRRVKEIMEQVGYKPNLIARSLAVKKPCHLVALIPDFRPGDYWSAMEYGIRRAEEEWESYGVKVSVLTFDQYSKASFEQAVSRLQEMTETVDGVIVGTLFKEAVIQLSEHLDAREIPYVYVDSDIEEQGRLAYYGTDSVAGGEIGARMLLASMAFQGDILVAHIQHDKGSMSTQGQKRYSGFLQYLKQQGYEVNLVEVDLWIGDEAHNEQVLDEAFRNHPGIRGAVTFNSSCYILGDYLEKRQKHEIRLVGYDLIDPNVRLLNEGYVQALIAQRPELQGYNGVKALSRLLLFDEKPQVVNLLPIDILLKENYQFYNKVSNLLQICVLGKGISKYLAAQGAKMVVLDRSEEAGKALVDEIVAQGHEATFLYTDVMNKEVLEQNKKDILEKYGRIDVLLNAAGGNMAGATIAPDKTFFDLQVDAFKKVVDLNLFGTVLPTMVFADVMVKQKKGSIVNFCSESALRPLTRVVGYGAAKAAIANFTKYMAGELAIKFGDGLRVNAIAPGFFLTEQNRTLLTNPDGSLTDRSRTILAHTPFGRFGEPEDLYGTIHYLISDASNFVTGTVAVIDGGFDAFSI